MRNIFLLFTVAIVIYSCIQLSAKDLPKSAKSQSDTEAIKPELSAPPDSRLRVGRDEAMEMRGRRGKDNASVIISAKDLLSLMSGPVNEKDSFIFYLVNYKNIKKESDRYKIKVPGANFSEIIKKPSSLLVGFVPGHSMSTSHIMGKMPVRSTELYDFGVVCPPPPDCNCVIEQ